MNDVDLYTNKTDSYNQIQNSRPDYTESIETVVQYAKKYIPSRAIVAAFCCGTGSVAKTISEVVDGLDKVVLIDINKHFLNIALDSNIKTDRVETIEGDILDVKFTQVADAVLSIFAYHHVPDKDKDKFVKQIKQALKPKGILILGEIYMPDRETTISYYNDLLLSVPKGLQTPTLKKFLEETAKSEEFEFKVDKSFADNQLKENGFTLLESSKIWPKDNTTTGTFVEVWQN